MEGGKAIESGVGNAVVGACLNSLVIAPSVRSPALGGADDTRAADPAAAHSIASQAEKSPGFLPDPSTVEPGAER